MKYLYLLGLVVLCGCGSPRTPEPVVVRLPSINVKIDSSDPNFTFTIIMVENHKFAVVTSSQGLAITEIKD